MSEVIIGIDDDGWTVKFNDKEGTYSYNYTDEDMGAEAVRQMLEDLGFTVTLEEWY